MQYGKNTTTLLWAGAAAATAGIAVVLAAMKWRERQERTLEAANHLRSVQDVLSDCYDKIREIETHLPQVSTVKPASRRATVRKIANGNPMLES